MPRSSLTSKASRLPGSNTGDTLGHIYFEGEYGANGLAGSKAFAGNNDMTDVEQKIKATDQDMSSQITSFKSQGVNAITQCSRE